MEDLVASLPVTRLIGLTCHYTYWFVMRAKVGPVTLPMEVQPPIRVRILIVFTTSALTAVAACTGV